MFLYLYVCVACFALHLTVVGVRSSHPVRDVEVRTLDEIMNLFMHASELQFRGQDLLPLHANTPGFLEEYLPDSGDGRK